MPGTIQVSVLEFKELSSSSPTSSVSLKVSMGKRVYQTWDKGDFTFPLTSFRDDLIIILQDDEGNKISHTGVKASVIVEKGSWDDIFHLEGGGYVHMKLQFILSEEERNLIRNVRESAMRKKQDRIPGINLATKTATAVGDSKQELSDRTEGTLSSPIRQEDKVPINEHDRSSSTEKLETQSTCSVALPRPIAEEHPQSKSGVSEKNVGAGTEPGSQKKDYDKSSKPQGQVVSGKKTSSTVRKMISAFETSLSQETRPLAKTQASKSQPNIVGMGGSLKDLGSKGALVSKTSQETQTNTGENRESSRFSLSPVGIRPSHSYTNLGSVATIKSSKGNSSIKHSLSVQESDRYSVAEKRGREVSSKISPEINVQRAPNEKHKSTTNFGNEHYDSESSGAWIFPDNMRNLCVTTAGKEVLNFLEDSCTEANIHQRKKRISLQGKLDALHETDPMMKDKEKSHTPHEFPAEGSANNGSSGPFGQVFKIAVIIGFGIFVLLNRQKETRMSGIRSKDGKSASTPEYMDQLTSSGEQWRTLMAKEE